MKNKLLWTMFLTGALAALTPQLAMAANTASNTLISNRATVNYKVATVAQTPIESKPGAGNSTPGVGNGVDTTFLVDDKVNLVIASANVSDPVTTYPGSSAVALKFTVTNTGNTVHDFALSHLVGTSTFTATAVAYYADTDFSGTYNAGDLAITKLDNLALNTPTVVFLVASVPITAVKGQVASYALKATATDNADTPLVATAGADTPGAVDIVLADIDSDGAAATDDAVAPNGVYLMWAGGSSGAGDPGKGYVVDTSALTVTKTSAVYSDPINGTTNPKAIPGAVVTYTITIANGATGATATDITIADSLATPIDNGTLVFNTAFKDAVNDCGADKGIVVGGTCQTNLVGGPDDQADFTNKVVNVAASGSLAATESKIIKFQVIIQ